jgi:hypothetical protein
LKIRVKEALSGAHFVFPSESSLAVRVYYPHDLDAVRSRIPPGDNHIIFGEEQVADSSNEGDGVCDVDVDGLLSFVATFRYALILAVIPDYVVGVEGQGFDYGEHPVLCRMQRVLEKASHIDKKITPLAGIVTVASTQQAIHVIVTMADALRPNTAELKAQYLKRQEDDIDPVTFTRSALFGWLASQPGINTEEINLLLMFTPSIGSLLGNDMNNIPCHPRIKHHVRSLFQSVPEQDASSVAPLQAQLLTALSPPPYGYGGSDEMGTPVAPVIPLARNTASTATRLFVAADHPPNPAAFTKIGQPPPNVPPGAYYPPPPFWSSWNQPSYSVGAVSVLGAPAAGAGGRYTVGGSTRGDLGGYYVAQQRRPLPPSSSRWPTNASTSNLSAVVPTHHFAAGGRFHPSHLQQPSSSSSLASQRRIVPN